MKCIRFAFAVATIVINQGAILLVTVRGQAASPGQVTAQSELKERLATIERLVEAKRKEVGVPGFSLVIVKDDQVIFAKGFGMRDVEHGLPVTPDTLMPIGSATKAFTAMAAAISVDQGKLSFDDRPVKYLHYFKLADAESNSKVTLRDLLSHRTGLASYTDVPWRVGTLNREQVIRVIGDAKPTAPLRSKFQYNNVMYSAVGEVVAAVQKTSWEQAISNLILTPLGMNATDMSIAEMQKSADFARGYHYDPAGKTTSLVPTRDLTSIAAAGAINSNARDMSRWLRLMLGRGVFEGKRLVSERNYHELVSSQIELSAGLSYAFGWLLASWHDHPVVWHNGGIDGFHSLVEMIPEQHLGFVILSNEDGSPLEGDFSEIILSNLIAGAVSPEVAAMPRSPAAASAQQGGRPIPDAVAKELAGIYQKDDFTATISEVGGALSLVVPGEGTFPLLEKDNDTLISPKLPSVSLQIKRDSKDKIASVTIKQPGSDDELLRQPTYSAPLSVDDLLGKAIDARGGEATLRKHTSMMTTGALNMVNQGVTGEATIFARAPNQISTRVTLEALGKKIGWTHDYFDGAAGGSQSSFTPTAAMNQEIVASTRVEDAYNELLDAKTIFRRITIVGSLKVDGEDAYVVMLTPTSGNAITEYYSTRSFLMLRRDTGGKTTYYSDYRAVDGQMVPFKVVADEDAGGKTIVTAKEVKFNPSIPDSEFESQR